MHWRHARVVGFAALLAGLALPAALPAPARAQEADAAQEDDEARAARLFSEGRRLYEEEKFKEAIDALAKAYELRPAPPILLNIARTFQKLGDKKKALSYYEKFLATARLKDPNRPTVEGIVGRLRKEVGATKGGGGELATPEAARTGAGEGEEEEPGAGRILQMIHTPVDSARVRTDIVISAELPPRVDADHVWLYYRQGGERVFRRVEMQPQGDAYVGRIPARHVTSTSLQYYIEANRKGAGKKGVVARAMSRLNPNIVVIEGGTSPALLKAQAKRDAAAHGPFFVWKWVASGLAVAALGVGAAGVALAADRASAVEDWALKVSCKAPCQQDPNNTPPTKQFSDRARDWESQGKTWSSVSIAMFVTGGVLAAGAGLLWYLDHRDTQERRRRLATGGVDLARLRGGPWVSPDGAGVSAGFTF